MEISWTFGGLNMYVCRRRAAPENHQRKSFFTNVKPGFWLFWFHSACGTPLCVRFCLRFHWYPTSLGPLARFRKSFSRCSTPSDANEIFRFDSVLGCLTMVWHFIQRRKMRDPKLLQSIAKLLHIIICVCCRWFIFQSDWSAAQSFNRGCR